MSRDPFTDAFIEVIEMTTKDVISTSGNNTELPDLPL